VTAPGIIGISFHNLAGTPPGSLVVGVGGGVPVRVTIVDEEVFVRVVENEGVVPRLTRVLVGVIFVERLVASFSIRFSLCEAVLSKVNILVPKATVGGAEISSVLLDLVHPARKSDNKIKKKISFFIDR
jgi:hypothetical protein